MNQTVVKDWERAARFFAEGQFEAARRTLQAMLAREPESAEAWLALARVDIQTGEVRHAADHALAAANLKPAAPRMLCDIAVALLTIGEVAAARDCLEHAAAAPPGDAATQQYLAMQYQNLGDHDAALAWMQRARASGLADPASRFCMAVQLTFHGRMADAEVELEHCATVHPPLGRAMAQLSQVRKQTPRHNHLALLERQLAEVPADSEDQAALEFARYKEFEDLGQYEDAWRSLRRANERMHARLRHDSAAERRTIEALRGQAAGLPPPRSPRDDGPTPIFIVGLPRSGTTLLDRLLGNHSEVVSAGELGTFRRSLERVADRFTGPMLDQAFAERVSRLDLAEAGTLYLANSQWRAKGHRFYTDKLPRNWLLVPLILAAIPGARILHMCREPVAVAFSNYRSYVGADYPYCYDEDALISHYAEYRRSMRRWHALAPGALLDVSYRALVADPEAELRKVFDFCGLDWQPGCAELGRNAAPVATLSAMQVRGSIEPGMGERWRRYESQLARLREGIAAAVHDIEEP
ncbi:MAG TPA: sulfotransferase [Rhodanobacteraceae bacterium]|nr:sulfotransferase [Rhodanobacteraceae bacterium]